MPENVPLLIEQFNHFRDAILSKTDQLKELTAHQYELLDLELKALKGHDADHRTAIKELSSKVDTLDNTRVRELEKQISAMKERQTLIAGIWTAITIISAALAAYLSAK